MVIELPNKYTDVRSPLALNGAELRSALAHFPTGVTAITGMDDTDPVGITIGSFASVSLEPALVGFFIGRDSHSWARIRSSGMFVVNLLASDQEPVCRSLASKSLDKFAEVAWSRSKLGQPLIDGARGWIQCHIDQEVETGDHTLVLGSVINLRVANALTGGPLMFYRGRFGSIDDMGS